jgi:hypothetical protein
MKVKTWFLIAVLMIAMLALVPAVSAVWAPTKNTSSWVQPVQVTPSIGQWSYNYNLLTFMDYPEYNGIASNLTSITLNDLSMMSNNSYGSALDPFKNAQTFTEYVSLVDYCNYCGSGSSAKGTNKVLGQGTATFTQLSYYDESGYAAANYKMVLNFNWFNWGNETIYWDNLVFPPSSSSDTEGIFINGVPTAIMIGSLTNTFTQSNNYQVEGWAAYNYNNYYVVSGNFTTPLQSFTFINGTVYQTMVPSFNATPMQGLSPLTVTFTDTSTPPPVAWCWTMGDGSTYNQASFTHTFGSPGSYNVTEFVENGGGTWASANATITAYLSSPLGSLLSITPAQGLLTTNFTEMFGNGTQNINTISLLDSYDLMEAVGTSTWSQVFDSTTLLPIRYYKQLNPSTGSLEWYSWSQSSGAYNNLIGYTLPVTQNFMPNPSNTATGARLYQATYTLTDNTPHYACASINILGGINLTSLYIPVNIIDSGTHSNLGGSTLSEQLIKNNFGTQNGPWYNTTSTDGIFNVTGEGSNGLTPLTTGDTLNLIGSALGYITNGITIQVNPFDLGIPQYIPLVPTWASPPSGQFDAIVETYTNDNSATAISGASVAVYGSSANIGTKTTGQDGTVTFMNLTAGNSYSAMVSAPGFNSVTMTFIGGSGQIINVPCPMIATFVNPTVTPVTGTTSSSGSSSSSSSGTSGSSGSNGGLSGNTSTINNQASGGIIQFLGLFYACAGIIGLLLFMKFMRMIGK